MAAMCIVILFVAVACFMVSFTGRVLAHLALKRRRIDEARCRRRLKVCKIFGLTATALTFVAIIVYLVLLV